MECCRAALRAVAAAAASCRRTAAERLGHDAPDRGGAAAALRAAAETAVDLSSRARRRIGDGGADLGVGEHVAGTDDHVVRTVSRQGRRLDRAAHQVLQKEITL
jgi:hypothetical protein